MWPPEYLSQSQRVAYRESLAENQVIGVGESFSDRVVDVEDLGLNARPVNNAHVWVKAIEAFPAGTRLNIQVIEARNADLTGPIIVIGETGELTERDLEVGEHCLWLVFASTRLRYVGLRFVSSGDVGGGRVFSVLTVEKPAPKEFLADLNSANVPMNPPLPPREPMRIG